MEEIRTKIAELKHICVTLDAQLKTRSQSFGEMVFPFEQSIEDQSLADSYQLVGTQKEVVSAIEGDISRIKQATSASELAKVEISKIEQRLASIEFEKNSLYSRIGVITYEEYAAGEIGEEFSLLFTSITHQNAELSKIQKNLKENELRYLAASFFEKMSLKMKRNKMKSELEKMDVAREDLFKNSGKQICSSDLIGHVKSKNAVAISKDFSRLDQERDRMYALLESRKFEFNQNQDLLNHSGVDGDVNKRIKELEKQYHKAKAGLDAAFSALGSKAIGIDEYRELAQNHEEILAIIYEINGLLAEREGVQRQLDTYDARLKIKELESTIDIDHQKETRVKSQVKVLNEQLEELKQRIASNRKQIAALKKMIVNENSEEEEK